MLPPTGLAAFLFIFDQVASSSGTEQEEMASNNVSGVEGEVDFGGWKGDCTQWSATFEQNIPQFAHSNSEGHMVTVQGVKKSSGSASFVVDADNELNASALGDKVELVLIESDGRQWKTEGRITKVSPEVNVSDGGEITVSMDWVGHGKWTDPDGNESKEPKAKADEES